MKEVVDWVIDEHSPERPQVHPRPAEMQQLLRVRRGRRGQPSGTAWPGSSTSAATRTPRCSFRARSIPVNGYLWVPKGAAHPVLAQVFINWRLAQDVQFPNAWPIDHGPWSELSEGFLGPDYVDQVPDWFADGLLQLLPDPRPDQDVSSSRRLARLQRERRRTGRTTTPRRSVNRLISSGFPVRPVGRGSRTETHEGIAT